MGDLRGFAVHSLRRRVLTLAAAFAIAAATFVVFGTPEAKAAPPAFRAASTDTGSGGGSLVINVPAGTVANDVMLTQITLDSGSATVTPPSGWTYLRDDGNGGIRQYVYYRVASGSEPVSYSWGISCCDSSGATVSYSGVDPVSPIHQHSGQAVPGSGTITAPSLTTTVADVTLVGLFGHDDGLAISPPGPMNERWDTASSETTTEGADEVIAVPGATGSRVATTAGGSNDNVGQLVALEPAAGGTASISGKIFVDIAGDGLPGAQVIGDVGNPFESGARIELFRDGGDGDPNNVDDTYVGFTTSSAVDGTYSFTGLAPGVYWITVDSHGVDRGPYNAGYSALDRWAEQTYGPEGAARYDGATWSFAGSAGPFYGGAEWDVSDDFTPVTSLAGAEHIARADVTGGSAINVDFGFSFDVVTSTRGATAAQDPNAGAGQRTVQGSLRQFITNANAQDGPNTMRFVPAGPVNDSTWWEILVTDPLPSIDDEETTIDGTAFDAADGTTVRNTTIGYLGANAAGGVEVGVDGVALPQVEKPELEIQGDQTAPLPPQLGFEILASQTTVRDLAIYGFGDAGTAGLDADIMVGPSVGALEGIVIERNVIGSAPGAFADPGLGSRSQGLGIRALDAVSGGGVLDNRVTDNLIGFMRSTAVLTNTNTGGWLITGNEIRESGTDFFSGRPDGVSVEGGSSTSHTITGNLIVDSSRVGVETWLSV